MTPPIRFLPGSIMLLAAATPASAKETHRPDTGTHAARGSLVVKQTDRGFVIVHHDTSIAERLESSRPTKIAVGTKHRIDRSIFMDRAASTAEATDADR